MDKEKNERQVEEMSEKDIANSTAGAPKIKTGPRRDHGSQRSQGDIPKVGSYEDFYKNRTFEKINIPPAAAAATTVLEQGQEGPSSQSEVPTAGSSKASKGATTTTWEAKGAIGGFSFLDAEEEGSCSSVIKDDDNFTSASAYCKAALAARETKADPEASFNNDKQLKFSLKFIQKCKENLDYVLSDLDNWIQKRKVIFTSQGYEGKEVGLQLRRLIACLENEAERAKQKRERESDFPGWAWAQRD